MISRFVDSIFVFGFIARTCRLGSQKSGNGGRNILYPYVELADKIYIALKIFIACGDAIFCLINSSICIDSWLISKFLKRDIWVILETRAEQPLVFKISSELQLSNINWKNTVQKIQNNNFATSASLALTIVKFAKKLFQKACTANKPTTPEIFH